LTRYGKRGARLELSTCSTTREAPPLSRFLDFTPQLQTLTSLFRTCRHSESHRRFAMEVAGLLAGAVPLVFTSREAYRKVGGHRTTSERFNSVSWPTGRIWDIDRNHAPGLLSECAVRHGARSTLCYTRGRPAGFCLHEVIHSKLQHDRRRCRLIQPAMLWEHVHEGRAPLLHKSL
jgi:hypothetical protein